MSSIAHNRRRFLVGCAAGLPLLAQRTASRSLADILTAIRFADLLPAATTHAKMIVASTLASAAAGTQLESARIIRTLAKESGGKTEATVWFDGARLPIASAARVNAMLSDAAASDDPADERIGIFGVLAQQRRQQHHRREIQHAVGQHQGEAERKAPQRIFELFSHLVLVPSRYLELFVPVGQCAGRQSGTCQRTVKKL